MGSNALPDQRDSLAGSMLGLFTGDSTFLVGVEDNPGGGLRCFLGSRHRGLYVIVDEPDEMAKVRNAWAGGGHVCFPTPPAEFIFSEKDDSRTPDEQSAKEASDAR